MGEFGIIQYTLSEDYLKLWVLDNDSNVLVNYEELNHDDYMAIDFITKHYIDVISEVIYVNVMGISFSKKKADAYLKITIITLLCNKSIYQ